MLFILASATLAATLLGGAFALRFKDKLHLILGFSAGAVIAIAFFDLLPEALSLGNIFGSTAIISFSALGFFAFMFLDRAAFLHGNVSEGGTGHGATGRVGATTLSVHSFLDGLAIGLAFQVNGAVGATVTAAVLTHDFSDGINTVNLILKNRGSKAEAWRWLFVDAIAPVLGVVATFFFALPAATLGVILAIFAGFFLYIGASDLLPESHHNHPTAWTTVATVLGALIIYSVIHIAG